MGPKKVAQGSEVMETIMSPISLIYDSELSDLQLQLLRQLHQFFGDSSFGSYSVILQHLWFTYGMVFEDKCLHYAVMAFSSAGVFGTIVRKVQTLEFLSKVNWHLMSAIKTNTVSESHLFAIFFATVASEGNLAKKYSLSRSREEREYISRSKRIYDTGFLEVMRHLNSERKNIRNPRNFPLSSLWRYILSQMYRIRGSSSGGKLELLHQCVTLPSDLSAYALEQEISDVSQSTDNRVSAGVIGPCHNPNAYYNCGGVELWWYVSKRLKVVCACCTVFLNADGGEMQDHRDLVLSVFKSIQSDVDELQIFPPIALLHNEVNLLIRMC